MSAEGKGTILIVEDEPIFSRIYQDVLTNDGCNVLVAEDGESGWQLAKSERPDLILLDLNLPKLHGFEVLKNIRADRATKDIPVLILTVLEEQKDIQKGFDLGATDYAVKGNYSPREILGKIYSLLGEAAARERPPTYKLSVNERKLDAAKLQKYIGLPALFACPECKERLTQELIPDYSRTDGHWFSAHFVCPNCQRSF